MIKPSDVDQHTSVHLERGLTIVGCVGEYDATPLRPESKYYGWVDMFRH